MGVQSRQTAELKDISRASGVRKLVHTRFWSFDKTISQYTPFNAFLYATPHRVDRQELYVSVWLARTRSIPAIEEAK
jgi:hypothetical protein